MKNLKLHIVSAVFILAVFVLVGCTESLDKTVKTGPDVKIVDTGAKDGGRGKHDPTDIAKGPIVEQTVEVEEESKVGEALSGASSEVGSEVRSDVRLKETSKKKEGDHSQGTVDYADAGSVVAEPLQVAREHRVLADAAVGQASAEHYALMQQPVNRRVEAVPMPGHTPPLAHGGTATVNGAAYDAEFYENYGVNPFVDADEDNLSTFAIDVDTASYTNARRYILGGNLPPRAAVRAEEFINYFDYGYESDGKGAFDIHVEGAPSKFSGSAELLQIGVKGLEIDTDNRKDATLTFVIDVSGSMGRENRLGLVKKSLRLLVDELTEADKVAIVVYGSRGRVVMEHRRLSSEADREYILRTIDSLHTEGATNAEEGLKLGYELAAKAYEKGRINRVILCSDGVANVGQTGAEAILKEVEGYADKGIKLSSIGFGMGNFNDVMMEKLGDKGDGHYAYVDTLDEARRVFVENLTGTLQVIAGEVKIQVDFNPNVVRSYRLIGYENRDVADDKFRADDEDGGEIGSGHSVTALYEVKFWEGKSARRVEYEDEEDGREYKKVRRHSDNVATVHVRYADPVTGKVEEVTQGVKKANFKSSFDKASDSLKLAAGAAEFAEILKENHWSKGSSFDDVLDLLHTLGGDLKNDKDVIELTHLVSKAREIKKRTSN